MWSFRRRSLLTRFRRCHGRRGLVGCLFFLACQSRNLWRSFLYSSVRFRLLRIGHFACSPDQCSGAWDWARHSFSVLADFRRQFRTTPYHFSGFPTCTELLCIFTLILRVSEQLSPYEFLLRFDPVWLVAEPSSVPSLALYYRDGTYRFQHQPYFDAAINASEWLQASKQC